MRLSCQKSVPTRLTWLAVVVIVLVLQCTQLAKAQSDTGGTQDGNAGDNSHQPTNSNQPSTGNEATVTSATSANAGPTSSTPQNEVTGSVAASTPTTAPAESSSTNDHTVRSQSEDDGDEEEDDDEEEAAGAGVEEEDVLEGGDEADAQEEDNVRLQALMNMANITSLADLVNSGLVYKDGHPATAADLNARVNSSTGKMYISNMRGNFPEYDECSPRPTTIRLNISNVDASNIVFPRCIKELRCGGCCRMPSLSCVPKYNEAKLYSLMLLRPSSRRNSVQLEAVGHHTVRVNRHLLCQCKCTLTADSCGPKKRVNRSRCACVCRNRRTRCRSPSTFNEHTCQCECPQHIVDSCDARLDPRSCNCHQNFMSSNNARIAYNNSSSVNAGADFASGSPLAPAPTTTPTTTTETTTTTTTTAPRPRFQFNSIQSQNPCGHIRCPNNFHAVRLGARSCSCRPLNNGPRRRPRPRGRHGRQRRVQ